MSKKEYIVYLVGKAEKIIDEKRVEKCANCFNKIKQERAEKYLENHNSVNDYRLALSILGY